MSYANTIVRSHPRRNGSWYPPGMRRSVQALIASLLPALGWAGPVDINAADAATLARELNGIGLSRAQAIVAYREKNGAFRSADDLLKVQGIGPKVLETNRANILLQRAAPATPAARQP